MEYLAKQLKVQCTLSRIKQAHKVLIQIAGVSGVAHVASNTTFDPDLTKSFLKFWRE
jgi:hypothetical protein